MAMLVNCKFTFLFKGTELEEWYNVVYDISKKLNELFPSLFLGALSVSRRCSWTFPCREETTVPWLLQLGGSTHTSQP